jgi:LysR family transcriptional regulator for metE and metH
MAIAESRTFATAAERVHLTQSASFRTRSARIERHYGVRLFDRSRQGARLTHAGDRLLALAREVLGRVAEAERDVARLKDNTGGELRIALECPHLFRMADAGPGRLQRRWPEIEVDLVSGFHSDPLSLLPEGKANLIVGSEVPRQAPTPRLPLFAFEVLLVMAPEHRLRGRRRIQAEDLRGETLITYPVPTATHRSHQARAGAGRHQARAAHRGAHDRNPATRCEPPCVAALPNWGVKSYVDHDYVLAKPIGAKGLWSSLYAVTSRALAGRTTCRTS